jgi:uracil-DNA glycosylase
MTAEKDRFAREILGHIRFYRGLGVEWTAVSHSVLRGGAQQETNRPPAAKREVPAVSKTMAKPELVTRIAAQNASMFDGEPQSVESLESIRGDIGDCRRCKLAPTRTHIVFGFGNPEAELMFVGEAPGADEDAQGLPFVGRAGQLLTKIIEAIEMKREDVYICNILKCRPPGNRNPEPDEIAACDQFLFRQIASVKPKVICALGTFSAQTLLRAKQPISALRGNFFEYRGARLMATFHPAYLLRNPNEKRKVWEDVQKIRDYLLSLKKGDKGTGKGRRGYTED